MSGPESAASEDFAAQSYLDSYNKPTLPDGEIQIDADSDHGQQRLTGPSLYGEKPRRWISEEEWLNIMKEDPHVREKPPRWISEEEWLNIMKDPGVPLRLWSHVTIFKIPDFLKDTKREAYVPHRVSLGPFHHGSPELTAMDHYKGRSLRKMMTDVDVVAFANNARNAILEKEDEIRNSYEESIDCDGNTLAMILSLDGCFILEVLKTLDERGFINDSIFGENMVSASKTLKDILMLENQIPWIVLLQLLRLENPEDDHVERTLLKVMVKATCGLLRISSEERTALLQLDWPGLANPKVHHLLGFVHRVIVHRPSNQAKPGNQGEHRISIERCNGRCLQMLACFVNRVIVHRPSKQANPGNQGEHRISIERCIGRCLQMLAGFVHRVIVHRPSNQANPGNQGEHRISIERCIGRCLQMLPDKNKALNHDFESIPPAVELKTAVELKNAGIRFQPCNGGIDQINFDMDSSTIYLPLLSITDDTEVLFRNLIAFEMCRLSEINYVSDYVNLMNDLIDSQKDVAFLKSMGILTNLLGSDKEVAGLFNGLFKGVTVRMPNIFDGLRKDVNANYKNRIANYKIKIRVQRALALAVAFALLCLTIIQRIYTVKK